MYRDVLKVYDQDCIIYNTDLDGTAYDIDSTDLDLKSDRETSWKFNWPVWFAMVTIWVLVLIFNSKSVDTIQYIVLFSWWFSLLFMLMFLIKAMTLGDGVSEGIQEYIWGDPKKEFNLWEELQSPSIWIDASTQCIYSVGLSICTIYGSYNDPVNTSMLGCALKMALYDTLYACCAGMCMWSVIGHLRAE